MNFKGDYYDMVTCPICNQRDADIEGKICSQCLEELNKKRIP